MMKFSTLVFLTFLLIEVAGCGAPNSLRLTFLGNSGFLLTDGHTTIAVDFPYQSGAFGYMEYDDSLLDAHQADYCLFTHSHADHRANELVSRFGCAAFGKADFPSGRLTLGNFDVTAFPTSHSDDHVSLLIELDNQYVYFTGDTESLSSLSQLPALNALVITPWLLEKGEKETVLSIATKIILSHHVPGDPLPMTPAVLVPRQNQEIEIDGT